MYSVRMMIS